jgi:hypothetical protein
MSRDLGRMERAALFALHGGDVLTVHDILHRSGLTRPYDEHWVTARYSDYASMLRALRRLARHGLAHCIAYHNRSLRWSSGAGMHAYVLASLYEPLSEDEERQRIAWINEEVIAHLRGEEPPPVPDFLATKGERCHVERFRRSAHAQVYITRP